VLRPCSQQVRSCNNSCATGDRRCRGVARPPSARGQQQRAEQGLLRCRHEQV